MVAKFTAAQQNPTVASAAAPRRRSVLFAGPPPISSWTYDEPSSALAGFFNRSGNRFGAERLTTRLLSEATFDALVANRFRWVVRMRESHQRPDFLFSALRRRFPRSSPERHRRWVARLYARVQADNAARLQRRTEAAARRGAAPAALRTAPRTSRTSRIPGAPRTPRSARATRAPGAAPRRRAPRARRAAALRRTLRNLTRVRFGRRSNVAHRTAGERQLPVALVRHRNVAALWRMPGRLLGTLRMMLERRQQRARTAFRARRARAAAYGRRGVGLPPLPRPLADAAPAVTAAAAPAAAPAAYPAAPRGGTGSRGRPLPRHSAAEPRERRAAPAPTAPAAPGVRRSRAAVARERRQLRRLLIAATGVRLLRRMRRRQRQRRTAAARRRTAPRPRPATVGRSRGAAATEKYRVLHWSTTKAVATRNFSYLWEPAPGVRVNRWKAAPARAPRPRRSAERRPELRLTRLRRYAQVRYRLRQLVVLDSENAGRERRYLLLERRLSGVSFGRALTELFALLTPPVLLVALRVGHKSRRRTLYRPLGGASAALRRRVLFGWLRELVTKSPRYNHLRRNSSRKRPKKRLPTAPQRARRLTASLQPRLAAQLQVLLDGGAVVSRRLNLFDERMGRLPVLRHYRWE